MRVRRKHSKTARLLLKLRRTPEGMTFTEIQKFVVRMNGLRWILEKRYNYQKGPIEGSFGYPYCWIPRYRGYWSDRLGRLLPRFCQKIDKRYVFFGFYSK